MRGASASCSRGSSKSEPGCGLGLELGLGLGGAAGWAWGSWGRVRWSSSRSGVPYQHIPAASCQPSSPIPSLLPPRRFVQCYSCGNPETVIKIRKKSETIELKCKACGHVRCGGWHCGTVLGRLGRRRGSGVQGLAPSLPVAAGCPLGRLCPAHLTLLIPFCSWPCFILPPGAACLPACLQRRQLQGEACGLHHQEPP